MEPVQITTKFAKEFRKHWRSSTADSNLTLHGFRRFKTSHLLNLRFLEGDIADLDHQIYQAGIRSGVSPTETDRLKLKHCKIDKDVPPVEETMTRELILSLRALIKEYGMSMDLVGSYLTFEDEALLAFNQIMSMDTFSLLDDINQSNLRDDLTLEEMYETRLLRTDLGPRSRHDPLQRRIHVWLRSLRYNRLKQLASSSNGEVQFPEHHKWSYQNSTAISYVISRVIMTVVTCAFLVIPLIILSNESRKKVQLGVVVASIVLLSVLVSASLRISNLEMMAISAAYAAVLSVFFSNI